MTPPTYGERVVAFARRDLPSVPSLRDLTPPASVEDALMQIRKGRSALLDAGLFVADEDMTSLSAEIRAVIDELDQVRTLLMAKAEGFL